MLYIYTTKIKKINFNIYVEKIQESPHMPTKFVNVAKAFILIPPARSNIEKLQRFFYYDPIFIFISFVGLVNHADCSAETNLPESTQTSRITYDTRTNTIILEVGICKQIMTFTKQQIKEGTALAHTKEVASHIIKIGCAEPPTVNISERVGRTAERAIDKLVDHILKK